MISSLSFISQVQDLTDEASTSERDVALASELRSANEGLRERVAVLSKEAAARQEQCRDMGEDLERQQTLYAELKKMRGRGEEMDMLQDAQQVANETCNTNVLV